MDVTVLVFLCWLVIVIVVGVIVTFSFEPVEF